MTRNLSRRNRGLTLIELLVVVAVLTAVTWLALDGADADMRQQRFDETRLRLDVIRRAIVGSGPANDTSWDGAWRLSGFVADNGRLPANLRELAEPAGLQTQTASAPKLKSVIDPLTCAGSGGDVTIPGGAPALIKGHRGVYLSGAANDIRRGYKTYRDGWNNIAATTANPNADRDNFGWAFSLLDSAGDSTEDVANAAAASVRSLGPIRDPSALSGSTPGDSVWETVQLRDIAKNDWSVNPAGWTVTARNRKETNTGPLQALLLAYENSGGGRWLHFASDPADCAAAQPDGAGKIVPESCEFIFSTPCGGKYIPQGRHLLLLVEAASNNKPLENSATSRAISTEVDLFAGAQPPRVVLEIR